MAFSWAQSITQYSAIEAVDINEIRNNTDYIADHISSYCNGHNSGVYSNYANYSNYVNYSAHNTAHYSGNYGSNLAADYA